MAPLPFCFLHGAQDLAAAVDAGGHPLQLLKAEVAGVGLLQGLVTAIPALGSLEWLSWSWRQPVALCFNRQQQALPEGKPFAYGIQQG